MALHSHMRGNKGGNSQVEQGSQTLTGKSNSGSRSQLATVQPQTALKAWDQRTLIFRDRQAAGQLSRAVGCAATPLDDRLTCPAEGGTETPVRTPVSCPGSCQNLVRARTPER